MMFGSHLSSILDNLCFGYGFNSLFVACVGFGFDVTNRGGFFGV
jgi:hypothetical protein